MLGEPQKHEKVVIIKNLFSPEDFDKEVALLLEYQQDIRSECLKCGDVRKVVMYDVSTIYLFKTKIEMIGGFVCSLLHILFQFFFTI